MNMVISPAVSATVKVALNELTRLVKAQISLLVYQAAGDSR